MKILAKKILTTGPRLKAGYHRPASETPFKSTLIYRWKSWLLEKKMVIQQESGHCDNVLTGNNKKYRPRG